ncbi:hypothetical protein CASFOL_006681 [Castilleja foliolosa]|uniref:Secreted protein n=1 Tax=Castilleja foliolosa TaxID=1961234 RepID=A0ABD3E722_9LAMI
MMKIAIMIFYLIVVQSMFARAAPIPRPPPGRLAAAAAATQKTTYRRTLSRGPVPPSGASKDHNQAPTDKIPPGRHG